MIHQRFKSTKEYLKPHCSIRFLNFLLHYCQSSIAQDTLNAVVTAAEPCKGSSEACISLRSIAQNIPNAVVTAAEPCKGSSEACISLRSIAQNIPNAGVAQPGQRRRA